MSDPVVSRAKPADYTVVKLFDDLPCTHRAWNQGGRCAYLHGYERSFTIEFGCDELDARTGFVVDFGALKSVRALLQQQFDHTTIIAEDDPEREILEELAGRGVIDLRVMRHPGMEGAAEWVYSQVDEVIGRETGGRVRVLRVEARESGKNAVRFAPVGSGGAPG